MLPQSLPPVVEALLDALQAPPRLVRHLIIVHHVALEITDQLMARWPQLAIDRATVGIGAATHDLGKVLHPEELTGPGRQHEEMGPALLMQHGLSAAHARFARTHGQWAQEPALQLEDLVIALADTLWKGQRDEQLELALARLIAAPTGCEVWQVYLQLDEVAGTITSRADEWLAWSAS